MSLMCTMESFVQVADADGDDQPRAAKRDPGDRHVGRDNPDPGPPPRRETGMPRNIESPSRADLWVQTSSRVQWSTVRGVNSVPQSCAAPSMLGARLAVIVGVARRHRPNLAVGRKSGAGSLRE